MDIILLMSSRNVLPIAALFSGTLWLGNAAYLYLSVSFIQMVKVCSKHAALRKGALPSLLADKYMRAAVIVIASA